MRFGVHVSIAGKIYRAVDRAVIRHCQAMQIFSGSPRNWRRLNIEKRDIDEFKKRRKEAKIEPLVLHLPYLTNLSSPRARVYQGSVELLKEAAVRAGNLDGELVVFHVGSYKGGRKGEGLEKLAQALRKFFLEVKPKCHILLENTAGSGYSLGSTFDELKFILNKVKAQNLGVCFDTAHAFAAGYDVATADGLEKTLDEFNRKIGLEKIKLIHANDSKTSCGSRVDRHQHIGKGYIELDGFRRIVNHPKLKMLPCILETPGMEKEDDIRNLKVIRSLVQGKQAERKVEKRDKG